jgi:hypothetical protein
MYQIVIKSACLLSYLTAIHIYWTVACHKRFSCGKIKAERRIFLAGLYCVTAGSKSLYGSRYGSRPDKTLPHEKLLLVRASRVNASQVGASRGRTSSIRSFKVSVYNE